MHLHSQTIIFSFKCSREWILRLRLPQKTCGSSTSRDDLDNDLNLQGSLPYLWVLPQMSKKQRIVKLLL